MISSDKILKYYVFIYFAPILFLIIGLDEKFIQLCTILSIFISLTISIRYNSFIYLLPLILILSPLAGKINIYPVNYYSDLILLLILVTKVLSSYYFKIKVPSKAFYVLLITIYLGIIINNLFYEEINIKIYIFIIQILVIFFIFEVEVNTLKQNYLLLDSIAISGFYGSLIALHYYNAGVNLINTHAGLDSFQNFDRATYYYAGLPYVVGISFLTYFIKIFENRNKLTYIALLIILTWYLYESKSKTTIISLIFTFIILAFIKSKKTTIAILLFSALALFVVEGSNEMLFLSSLLVRFEVWENALNMFIMSPVNSLFGYGIGYIDYANDASLFTKSILTGVSEGNVDSTYLNWLIDIGLFSFSIVISMLIINFLKFYKLLNFNDGLRDINIITIFIYTFFWFFTQSIGYSKIFIIFIFIILISRKIIEIKESYHE